MRLFPLLALAACTPMPELDFNEPPGAPTLRITPEDPHTDDTLVVDLEAFAVDPEGDDVEYRWAWYVDGALRTEGATTVEPGGTLKGQVWEVVGIANDGEFDGPEARASVTIANSLPVIANATLGPAAADTDDDLTLDLEATDADLDGVQWRVTWSRDGVEMPAYADALTIPADATGSQEEWTAVVTPFDGEAEGEGVTLSAYVDNTPPTLTGLTTTPSAPTIEDAIAATATGRFDPDPGQTVSVTFTWYVNGAEVVEEVSSTGTSFLSDVFLKGDDVTVVATPFDGFAYGEPLTTGPVTVVNTPPALDGATLGPATAYEGTELTCTPGTATDVDGDRVTYRYAWRVDGAAVSSTSSTLTGSSFAKGDEVYCEVTPEDGEEDGAAVRSGTVTIQNTAPAIASVSISPAAPTVASTVTAVVTGPTDADGDSVSYSYAWTVNGVAMGGSTATLPGATYERGDTVAVTVTPTDGAATGSPLTSDAVTIANAVPTLSGASITPSTAYTDDDLTVTVSGWSDADGDPASYTYQWYRNGTALAGRTSTQVPASETTRGDRFYCAVTPNDGYVSGAVRNTPQLTISNSAPVAYADVPTGTTATECDVIELDASGSTDDDGDTLTYAWTVPTRPSGSLASTSSFDTASSVAPLFQVDASGTFVFNVSVSDGAANNTDSVSVTVYDDPTNEAPVAIAGDDDTETGYGACSFNGTSWTCGPCTGTTFSLDAGNSYDNDGDPLTYVWSTTSGFASLSSSTGETTTLRMQNLPASHGIATTYSASVRLRVTDCAGNAVEDYVTLTFECTGT